MPGLCKGAAARAAVNRWNHLVRPGDPVSVLLDNGQRCETRTRSEAWTLGDGVGPAVVLVVGFSGGYALDRVKEL